MNAEALDSILTIIKKVLEKGVLKSSCEKVLLPSRRILK